MKKCSLCELELNDDCLNFHHLIPKSFHSNKRISKLYSKQFLSENGVYLCIPCHNKLHSCITEKDLAFQFDSIEKIKTNEEIKKWMEWKQKHPNFNNSYNRMTIQKRRKNK